MFTDDVRENDRFTIDLLESGKSLIVFQTVCLSVIQQGDPQNLWTLSNGMVFTSEVFRCFLKPGE